jgi:hypothetical protein
MARSAGVELEGQVPQVPTDVVKQQLQRPGAEAAVVALLLLRVGDDIGQVAQAHAAAFLDRPLDPFALIAGRQGAAALLGEGAVGQGAAAMVALAGATLQQPGSAQPLLQAQQQGLLRGIAEALHRGPEQAVHLQQLIGREQGGADRIALAVAVGAAPDLRVEAIGLQQMAQVVAQHGFLIAPIAALDVPEAMHQVLIKRDSAAGAPAGRSVEGVPEDVAQQGEHPAKDGRVRQRRVAAMHAATCVLATRGCGETVGLQPNQIAAEGLDIAVDLAVAAVNLTPAAQIDRGALRQIASGRRVADLQERGGCGGITGIESVEAGVRRRRNSNRSRSSRRASRYGARSRARVVLPLPGGPISRWQRSGGWVMGPS